MIRIVRVLARASSILGKASFGSNCWGPGMDDLTKQQAEKHLTIGYVLTLLGIGFFAGMAVLVQNHYVSVEEKAANALSMMSRQQIQIQQIILSIRSLASSSSNQQPHLLKDQIQKLAEGVLERHESLLNLLNSQSGILWDLQDTVILSRNDIESYESLDNLLKNLVEAAKRMAHEGNELVPAMDQEMDKRYIKIISTLDGIQESYAMERHKKIEQYKKLHIVGYFLLLFVILLAGAFVFRPIAAHVKRTRIALEQARKQAEKASQVKTDFLANISHEIRTPLSGMIGSLEMLLGDSTLEVQHRDTVLSIRRSARHLKSLIDDILDLAKVEAGTVEIIYEEFDFVSVIHEVKSIVIGKMEDKGLDFSILFQTEIPEYIESDSKRIIQILANVLSNGTKFTDEGHISLKISATPLDSGKTQLIFTISDTGCGIPQDKTKKLFKRFSQVDSSMTRKTAGAGLGLALSRHLAMLLGGDLILVSSAVGVGSVFQFRLTCEVPEKTRLISSFDGTVSEFGDAVDSEALKDTLKGVRILLVEDGHANQRIYNHFLSIAGAMVHSCWDGEAGLAYGSKHDDIDVVLMDIQLPKMDGYQVTTELRKQGFHKPIIALTAHAMQEEKEKCLRSGFDHYITKPVSIPILIRSIIKFSGPSPVEGSHRLLSEQTPMLSKYHSNEIYGPLIVAFVDTLEDRLADMQEALEAGDWTALKKAAHKVKGAAATYGFPMLTEQAGHIENLFRGKQQPQIRDVERYIEEFTISSRAAIAGAAPLRS